MNWKTLIAEIQAAGMSQLDIGRHLHKSQAWVSAVAAGKYSDLKWADGEALRQLHAARVLKLGAGETAPVDTHQEAA